ncbi:MAG: helix-turn-helix transcriptional regulator [Bacteroidales bacterium]|nr:helix-turn-helix transcriptional regulator [Bacteroidales bacterium]
MTEIKKDTKLHEIVLFEPTIVTVLYRFGIELGLADATVESICAAKEIDMDFFLAVLNTYLSPSYFPESKVGKFRAPDIVNYLSLTNQFYEQVQIPNIERHFGFLLQRSESQNSNLALMMRFFVEVKNELLQRIGDDRDKWFPQLLDQYAKCPDAPLLTDYQRVDESDAIEDKINDLINMFVIHLKGKYDHNLCQAVLISLASFKKDITQNNRIRYRILAPFSQALLAQ